MKTFIAFRIKPVVAEYFTQNGVNISKKAKELLLLHYQALTNPQNNVEIVKQTDDNSVKPVITADNSKIDLDLPKEKPQLIRYEAPSW